MLERGNIEPGKQPEKRVFWPRKTDRMSENLQFSPARFHSMKISGLLSATKGGAFCGKTKLKSRSLRNLNLKDFHQNS